MTLLYLPIQVLPKIRISKVLQSVGIHIFVEARGKLRRIFHKHAFSCIITLENRQLEKSKKFNTWKNASFLVLMWNSFASNGSKAFWNLETSTTPTQACVTKADARNLCWWQRWGGGVGGATLLTRRLASYQSGAFFDLYDDYVVSSKTLLINILHPIQNVRK